MKKLIIILFIGLFSCQDDCTQPALATLVKTSYVSKFDEKEKVLVCHNGTTLEVNAKALQGHLNHGDTIGVCATLSTNGLHFNNGEVQEIDCSYELPFMHIKENGEQWLFTKK